MSPAIHRMALAQVAVTGCIVGAFERIKGERRRGLVEYVGIALVTAAPLGLIKDSQKETLGRAPIQKVGDAIRDMQDPKKLIAGHASRPTAGRVGRRPVTIVQGGPGETSGCVSELRIGGVVVERVRRGFKTASDRCGYGLGSCRVRLDR